MTTPDEEYEPLRPPPVTGPQPQAAPGGPATNGTSPSAPGAARAADGAAAPGTGSPPGYGPAPGYGPGPGYAAPSGYGQPQESGPTGYGQSPDPAGWQTLTPVPGPTDPVPAPMPIPTRTATRGGPDDTVRLGLWGGPRSGKTTVISALPIAALANAGNSHGWIVTGVSDIASKILNEGMYRLVTERRFPPSNVYGSPVSIMWSFQGQEGGPLPGEQPRWSSRFRRASPGAIDFALQLQDFSGESFDYTKIDPLAVESLALSQGLIYVFDPVLEYVLGNPVALALALTLAAARGVDCDTLGCGA